MKLFDLIDINNSHKIERDETLRFWSSNFPTINSNELFNQVDKNNNGEIDLDEWIDYWTIVSNSGYSDKEICNELDNMIKGGCWVQFKVKKNKKLGRKIKLLKQKGKC